MEYFACRGALENSSSPLNRNPALSQQGAAAGFFL
jgi:hypothetical protein